MSSYLSDLEHHRINAQVFPGLVVETHHVSDYVNGERKEPKVKLWKIERVLGKGSSAEVRLEAMVEGSEKRAVKRIWMSGITQQKEYQRELMALLEFSKPKYKETAVFVEFLGWFEDLESVYLAMEYIPLGDLEQNVPAQSRITEGEIRDIASQILEGLRIMHLENFAHRDLKPKNVLVCRGPPCWWVKLTDFGLSKRLTEDTEYRTHSGTQSYMAPEVLNYVERIDPTGSEYTNAIDLWALGCIIYRLASGFVPFPPGLKLVEFCTDKSGFPFHFLALKNLGLAFLSGILEPYPARRWTAQQALGHPWMKIDLDFSYLNPRRPLTDRNQQRSDVLSTNFGVYNTDTHLGLQSIASFRSETPPIVAPRQLQPDSDINALPDVISHFHPNSHQFSAGPNEIGHPVVSIPKPAAGPIQKMFPLDANSRKAFSEGMTKAQLADLGLFLEVPALTGSGPEERRRWGGVWPDPLRPTTSFPDLQTHSQNSAQYLPMDIDRGRFQAPLTHTRNLSAPKITVDPSSQMSFRSRVSMKQGSSLAPSNKSTKRTTKKKKSKQAVQDKTTELTKPNLQAPDVTLVVVASGEDHIPAPEGNNKREVNGKITKPSQCQDQNSKRIPGFQSQITEVSKVPDSSSSPPTTVIDPPKDKTINNLSHPKTYVKLNASHPIEEMATQFASPQDWTSGIPSIEGDVTSAFKAFALRQRRMVEESQAKRSSLAKATLLNDLVSFSSTFTLSTPVPKDLIPILAKDPRKQNHIYVKSRSTQKGN